MTRFPRGFPGPWRILEECAAPTHNTIRAACNRNRGALCICPRALAIKEERNMRKRWSVGKGARALDPTQNRKRTVNQDGPSLPPMPDMSLAACATLEGRDAADVASVGMGGYPAMREFCNSCPLMDGACREYILAAESPAGSWGGIWAGMSPGERIRARR